MKQMLAAALLLIVSLSSCHRRPILRPGDDKALVRILVDWDGHFSEQPGGMTVSAYGPDSKLCFKDMSNETDSMDITLPEGENNILLFNYTPDEFGSMRFYDMDDFHRARVGLTRIMMRTPVPWDAGADFVRQPELLTVAADTVDITSRDVRLSRGWRQGNHQRIRRIQEAPMPINSTIYIDVWVEGLINMKSVEGSINGMAGGCMLATGESTAERVTHLLEAGSARAIRAKGAAAEHDGWLRFRLDCFGMPRGEEDIDTREDGSNIFKLHFLLRDNKTTVDYEALVGRHIAYLGVEEGGTRANYTDHVTKLLYLRISHETDPAVPGSPLSVPCLPDVIPEGDQESGFDADVDEWEDGGEIEIEV